MNNTVNVNGAQVQINNLTVYNPDAIINRYCANQGTNVQTEIGNRMARGMLQVNAAQDLFVRAVRSVEREQHRAAFVQYSFVVSCIKEIMNNGGVMHALGFALLSYTLGRFVMGLCYDVVVGITDRIGINAQYSI